MKHCKVIVTVGYPEMAQKFLRIAKELEIEITIVEGILDEAANEVIRLVEKSNHYEAIISRTGTAQLIKEHVQLPVIHHDSDHFDLIDSFYRAKELGDNICFITYPEKNYSFDFKRILKLLPFHVNVLPYSNNSELIKQIQQAKKLNMDVVVGGGIRAAQMVQNLQMKSMFLTSSERNIRRALTLASQITKDRNEIKSNAEIIKAIMNSSHDAIVFINKNQMIQAINSVAESLFKLNEKSVVGLHYESVFNALHKDTIKRLLNQKKQITNDQLHFSSTPLIVNLESIGTVITCREIQAIQKLEKKIRVDSNKKGLTASYTFSDMIHNSESMSQLINLSKSYAQNDATILIIGESGTGKEVLAQSIHNESPRKDGPFVALNCAALPENILENELFGHVEGAFTGALKAGRAGVFELAHGGTIFLDEIGEIPLHIQTRLLRVLQERNVMRIGADYITPVDIRVIAATNKKLWELVCEKKFRLDLYFRLSVLHLMTSPLRQRKEDIPSLVQFFLYKKGLPSKFEDLSKSLQHFCLSYDWPGNIRQLENIIERYIHIYQHNRDEAKFIESIQLETKLYNSEKITPLSTMLEHDHLIVEEGPLQSIEIQVIEQMLDKYNNNKSLVADILQVSRTTLWKKLQQ